MGAQWGVNRSVARSMRCSTSPSGRSPPRRSPSTLGLARSNVSNSIRELMAWDLIRRVPVKGDRRDHFEAETDLWEIAMRIAAVRKEREIDPAVDALQRLRGGGRARSASCIRSPASGSRTCSASSSCSIAGTRRC